VLWVDEKKLSGQCKEYPDQFFHYIFHAPDDAKDYNVILNAARDAARKHIP